MILSTANINSADWDVWSLCADGDFFMLPLLVMLLIVIYVFCERVYFISRAARLNNTFISQIKDYVHENEIESAENLCRKTDTPSARIVLKGLSLLGHSVTDIHNSLNTTVAIEKARLKTIIQWLPFIATAAPVASVLGALMGLLRYVYENPDVMDCPQKIFTPFMTVVVGLIVALVAMCAYRFLLARLNKVDITLHSIVDSFIGLLNEPVA